MSVVCSARRAGACFFVEDAVFCRDLLVESFSSQNKRNTRLSPGDRIEKFRDKR